MRYYEQTTQPANGQLVTSQDMPLKSVNKITPRFAPSFLRVVLLPVLISVGLISLAAYAISESWLTGLGWGAGLSVPFAYWRVLVWDGLPTDAIDQREYQEVKPMQEMGPLIRPVVTSNRPGSASIKYGRFAYSERAWRTWAQVMRANKVGDTWKITRAILADVQVDGYCIFKNLNHTYNDLVNEMYRLGWTDEDKGKLSEAGIAHFMRWLNPPTPQ